MLCDKCRERTATIYYTELVNGQLIEHHLCEKCAIELAGFEIDKDTDITIGDVLSSLLTKFPMQSDSLKEIPENKIDDGASQDSDRKTVIKCENCNMTYDQFLREGRFGCPQCYQSFRKILVRSLKKAQQSDTHIGKIPEGFQSQASKIISEMKEVDKKKILLQEAIEKEDFDRAVELREEIYRLQAQDKIDSEKSHASPCDKEEINHV